MSSPPTPPLPMASPSSAPARPLRRPRDLARMRDTLPSSLSSASFDEQFSVEGNCLAMYHYFWNRAAAALGNSSDQTDDDVAELMCLNREKTLPFLLRGLQQLSPGYACLDASRPWLVYWILHSLELLEQDPGGGGGRTGGLLGSAEATERVVDFLSRCRNPDGGFGGGPGQLSHLAPTYAAVNALAILGTDSALSEVDRPALSRWLASLRLADGSFNMHADGEVDIRGVYCALSVARLTNVFTQAMFENTAEWILRCQTYEGGFGGAPGMEAHGGYTFCGLAALVLLGRHRLCREDRLLRWAANRQMRLEGGFQGRTNKLVDGCYSFWQGGIFPLLHGILGDDGQGTSLPDDRWLFDQEALQEYLLLCCQDPRGGLVDKPGKGRDFYHTCYTLSGLSVSQNFKWGGRDNARVMGPLEANHLIQVHPLHNIGMAAAAKASSFYGAMDVPSSSAD